MYEVKVSLECGCFKKSAYNAQSSFENKEEALSTAQKMVDDMNTNFCGKHKFSLNEDGNNINIEVALA
jgi:hypothetical protein